MANGKASGVFVAGIPTPNVDMPLSGTATYTGVAEAAWRGPTVTQGFVNPTTYASGAFSHTVDFASGNGNGTMDLNGSVFTSNSVHSPGDPGLAFTFNQGETAGGTGVGSFTGPHAENMGVVFQIYGLNGMAAAGAIRAERGAITPPVVTNP